MYYLTLKDKIFITDASESDFRQMLSDELGDDAVKWFDTIMSETVSEASKTDWEEEAREKESIAEYYSDALHEVLGIVQDSTKSNKVKLDEIKRLVNITL